MRQAAELKRILAFQARLDDQVAEEVLDWDFGRALVSASLPLVWDGSYFRLESAALASGGEIAASAARLAREAGIAHVAIVAGQRDSERLGPELEALGFERTRHVIMALRRQPGPPGHDVRSVRLEDVASSRAEVTLEFDPGADDLVVQLAELDRRFAAAIGERWFAVLEDGRVVSRAWLRGAGGVGQVEDVATTPTRRRRGYASAVVSAAATASLDAGYDLTFIVADADDTVPELYRKIGFEPIGMTERFVRPLTG